MHFTFRKFRCARGARLSIAGAATLLLLWIVPASDAAVISASDATATFVAEGGETNDVTVEPFVVDGELGIIVRDAGATLTAGAGCTAVAGGVACPSITFIEVHLGSKDDRIHLSDPPIRYVAVVYGGSGNDHIAAANPLGGEYYGESGNDVMTGSFNEGGAGTVFSGGTGDDTIAVNDSGGVSVFGDNGNDSIFGGSGGGFANFAFGGRGDDRLEAIEFAPWFLDGGPGDDIIIGGIPQ